MVLRKQPRKAEVQDLRILAMDAATRLGVAATQIADEVASRAPGMVERVLDETPAAVDRVRREAPRVLSAVADRVSDLPGPGALGRFAAGSVVAGLAAIRPRPKKRRGYLLAGMAAGAAAVYFLDPQSGAERRSAVAKGARDALRSSGVEAQATRLKDRVLADRPGSAAQVDLGSSTHP